MLHPFRFIKEKEKDYLSAILPLKDNQANSLLRISQVLNLLAIIAGGVISTIIIQSNSSNLEVLGVITISWLMMLILLKAHQEVADVFEIFIGALISILWAINKSLLIIQVFQMIYFFYSKSPY